MLLETKEKGIEKGKKKIERHKKGEREKKKKKGN